MVAYHHKAPYALFAATLSAEQADDMRFEYLRCFVYNGKIEAFHSKQCNVGIKGRCGCTYHTRAGNELFNVAHRIALLYSFFQQMPSIALFTVQRRTYTEEINACLAQFAAYFVDRTIGVCRQQNGG